MSIFTPTKNQVREPRWVRDALRVADREVRRISTDEIESVLASVRLDAAGGRVVTSLAEV